MPAEIDSLHFLKKGWCVTPEVASIRYMRSPSKKYFAFIVTTLVFGAALTETRGQAAASYNATEAAKHVGENATITDTVDSVHQSGKGNIFLNMGGRYPNQAFTAFIPAGSAAQFSNIQEYQGRTVAVSGKIALYKGKPEIVVMSPSQIVAK